MQATKSKPLRCSLSATATLLLFGLICGLGFGFTCAERDFNFNDSQVPLLEPKDEPPSIYAHGYIQDPYAAEVSRCHYADSEIMLSLVLKSHDWPDLSVNKKAKVLDKLSKFFAIPKEFIVTESVTKHELNEMQKESMRKGNNKCHIINRRLGRVNLMLGCGASYFTMGEPIASQIGAQMKDGSIDNITGEKFGWWVIWRKHHKSRAQRNRRQAEGSGEEEDDYDDYEYDDDEETPETVTEPPAVTTHAHRHHHGVEKSDLNENSVELELSNNHQPDAQHVGVDAVGDGDEDAGTDADANADNTDVDAKTKSDSESDDALLLLNKNGVNLDEEIVESVSQLESVITKTIENTKHIKELPVVEEEEAPVVDEPVAEIEKELESPGSMLEELSNELQRKTEQPIVGVDYATSSTTAKLPASNLNGDDGDDDVDAIEEASHASNRSPNAAQLDFNSVEHTAAGTLPTAAVNMLEVVEESTTMASSLPGGASVAIVGVGLEQSKAAISTAAPPGAAAGADATATATQATEHFSTLLTTTTATAIFTPLSPHSPQPSSAQTPALFDAFATPSSSFDSSLPSSYSSASSSSSSFLYSTTTTATTTPTPPLLSPSATTTKTKLQHKSLPSSYDADELSTLSPNEALSEEESAVHAAIDSINTPITTPPSTLTTNILLTTTITTTTATLIHAHHDNAPTKPPAAPPQITGVDVEDINVDNDDNDVGGDDDDAGVDQDDDDDDDDKKDEDAEGTTYLPEYDQNLFNRTAYSTTPQAAGGFDSSSAVTTTTAAPPPELTSGAGEELENTPPMIRTRLQKLAVTSGKSFTFTVPADTFYDSEDNINLRLVLTDLEGQQLKPSSWLQFNAESHELYGLPLDDSVSKWQYQLTATDSGNASVTETVELSVQQHRGVRTVNHEINIAVKINEKNMPNIDWQLKLMRGIADTLGDESTGSIVVREIRQTPQDPHSATFVYFNETLPTSECPEVELNSLVKRLDASRLSDLVHPMLGVKSITGQLTGSCQKSHIAMPKPTTHMSKNLPPMPRNQVDRVNATVGHLLVFKVPSDTFYDPNDNELTLTLKSKEHKELSPRHWLQFDSKNQEFYGIPKSGDIGSEEYLLVAEDSGGLSATDALVVVVNHAPKKEFSAYFKAYLAIRHEQFNADLQRKFVERVSQLFGDQAINYVQIRSVTTHHDSDSTIVNFYNTTLFKSHNRCPEEEIDAARSVYLMQDSLLRDSVKKALGPELNLTNVQVIPLGSCHPQTDVTHREFPATKPEEPTLKSTFPDNYLYTVVLPAAIILVMILIASLIACCLHRRRHKSGKMELGDEEERKAFRTKGIPVIFQDELDEKPEIGKKSPTILKIEKPPLLPPSNHTTAMNGDNDVDEYVPPPAVVMGGREARGKSPATPSYRKPPPYVSP